MTDLNKFTKADLIWLINRILQMTTLSNANYYINRAISDLEYEKEKRRLDEAMKYGKIADKKRKEYFDILEQCEGEKYIDIPLEVLEKVQKLLEEAQAADKKWCKLMNINMEDAE